MSTCFFLRCFTPVIKLFLHPVLSLLCSLRTQRDGDASDIMLQICGISWEYTFPTSLGMIIASRIVTLLCVSSTMQKWHTVHIFSTPHVKNAWSIKLVLEASDVETQLTKRTWALALLTIVTFTLLSEIVQNLNFNISRPHASVVNAKALHCFFFLIFFMRSAKYLQQFYYIFPTSPYSRWQHCCYICLQGWTLRLSL